MVREEILVCGNVARDVILGEEHFGGSASVIAANLKKLGVPAGILSVIGNDAFSKGYHDYLVSEGVGVELLTSPLRELPTCEVSSSDNVSSARRWTDNGCRIALTEMDFSMELLENKYKIIHLVSCPPELVAKFVDATVTLSYDPGPRIIHDPAYINRDILAKSRYMFANDEEMNAIQIALGISEPAEIAKNYQLEALIVTHGESGSVLYHKNGDEIEVSKIKSYSVDCVDPTGAGDAYRAGFLFGITSGVPLKQACRFGSYLAALVVSQKGGILTEDNLNKFKHAIHGNTF